MLINQFRHIIFYKQKLIILLGILHLLCFLSSHYTLLLHWMITDRLITLCQDWYFCFAAISKDCVYIPDMNQMARYILTPVHLAVPPIITMPSWFLRHTGTWWLWRKEKVRSVHFIISHFLCRFSNISVSNP